MNKKTLSFASALLVLITLASLWRCSPANSKSQPVRTQVEHQQVGKVNQDQLPPDAMNEKRATSIFDALNVGQVHIVFYGKVIDENELPISNAIIDYQIVKPGGLLVTGAITQRIEKGSVSSDQKGDFEISGSGESLSVTTVRKVGYRESQGHQLTFSYFGGPESYRADKENPRVFVLLSNSVDNTIQHLSSRLSFPWDGQPLKIDLNTGKVAASGALVIIAKRSGQNMNFDWQFSLAIEGGELQEVPNGIGFIAPSQGYHPSWECGYSAKAKPWRSGRDAILFHRINGKYGRLNLSIYADAGPTSVSLYLESFGNNVGGRNTEGRQ